MACFHPISAFQCANGEVVFSELARYDIVSSLQLPCGQCIGCRLERSRQWATRCLHEASLHDENAFITLTYDDAHLPADGSLHYLPFQNFMKRLRKFFHPRKVRFYMCGEYGSDFDRPHFHACLFGVDFPDKQFWSKTESGCSLFRSSILEALWPNGFSSIGDVNFETAAYVARYIVKKVNGDLARLHYQKIDPETGEIIDRVPEFTKMSLKPGIGARWFEKWQSDIYPQDYVVVRGKKCRPPRYYDQLLKHIDPETLETLKFERGVEGRTHIADNSDSRLAVREQVAAAGLNQFPRKLS